MLCFNLHILSLIFTDSH